MTDPVFFWTRRRGLRHEVVCWSCGPIATFRFRFIATMFGRQHGRGWCPRDLRGWPDDSLVRRWHDR